MPPNPVDVGSGCSWKVKVDHITNAFEVHSTCNAILCVAGGACDSGFRLAVLFAGRGLGSFFGFTAVFLRWGGGGQASANRFVGSNNVVVDAFVELVNNVSA